MGGIYQFYPRVGTRQTFCEQNSYSAKPPPPVDICSAMAYSDDGVGRMGNSYTRNWHLQPSRNSSIPGMWAGLSWKVTLPMQQPSQKQLRLGMYKYVYVPNWQQHCGWNQTGEQCAVVSQQSLVYLWTWMHTEQNFMEYTWHSWQLRPCILFSITQGKVYTAIATWQ